ncbi:hypothetical protein [Phreatobacter sp.]|uniref:hypothetical protein n=1 Tax=Phreatobacter sp. TaxID=1966341 RepID=UPI003F6ECA5B
MTKRIVVPPPVEADVSVIVDWLELTSFFDHFGRARVDEIAGSFKTQEETPPDNFGDADRDNDNLREGIENEVLARQKALGDAYPFALDDTGEEFRLERQIDDPRASFYLLCLIATHISKSVILSQPPCDKLVYKLRNRVFQVLGTLAVAGFAQGPAVSVGYPRQTKEGILTVLARAQQWGSGLIARNKPGKHANPRANDAGIDVIGWPQSDRPPPPHIYFAQLASGKNWTLKPAMLEYSNFMDDFFEEHGTAQHNFVTIIPHRIFDELTFTRQSKTHKAIFDRHRAPRHALAALQLHDRGVLMDEACNAHQIYRWLRQYRRSVSFT